MMVDTMMCYCEQPTVVGQLLCQKVVVRAPADDSVAASLMIVSMFLVAQGNFSCHLTAFHLLALVDCEIKTDLEVTCADIYLLYSKTDQYKQ